MNSEIKLRVEAHRTREGTTDQTAKDVFDRLQRKILRRSKHLGEHIDDFEVRRWAMNWKLDCFGGKES